MSNFRELLAKYGVLAAFVLLIAFFCLMRPDSFASFSNMRSILVTAAPSAIVAMGLTVALVMNDFDLSFGSMIALSGGTAIVLQTEGTGWVLALAIALGLGIAGGLLNGILVAVAGASSFIITLAMGTVFTGLEFAFTKQNTIFQGAAEGYLTISQGSFLDLSNMVWIALAIALILWIFLDYTEIGRYMYAVGGNPEAARLSGVPNKRLRILGFIAVSICAAIVGVLLTSNSGSYTPAFGVSFLLPAFAAAFLGAAVFRPGQFNIPGTLLGVLFLGVIATGLTMMSLDTFIINLVQGGILIVAVLLSRLGERTI